MKISLTPEQEKIVQEKLKSGRFRTPEEVVDEALRALRHKEQPLPSGTNGSQREAVHEMLAFVQKNHVQTF